MLEPSLDAVKSRFGSQRRVQRRRPHLWPDSDGGTRATIGAVLRARADAPPRVSGAWFYWLTVSFSHGSVGPCFPCGNAEYRSGDIVVEFELAVRMATAGKCGHT